MSSSSFAWIGKPHAAMPFRAEAVDAESRANALPKIVGISRRA
jgi:hypothetical protein